MRTSAIIMSSCWINQWCWTILASFPGPAQLSVTCSCEVPKALLVSTTLLLDCTVSGVCEQRCCVRSMPASTLSSEFCTVKILEGPKNLSALWNSKESAFGSIHKYSINDAPIKTTSSGCISEVATTGRCPFRKVPLYCAKNTICWEKTLH